MTKTEAREIMTAELVSCISKSLSTLPTHIKIDLKGTKNFISFQEYGMYACFYVTSDLAYSLRYFDEKETNVCVIEYDKVREKKELKKLVKVAFQEVSKKLTREGHMGM